MLHLFSLLSLLRSDPTELCNYFDHYFTRIDLHIFGGFVDDQGTSEEISNEILGECITLKTAKCVAIMILFIFF